MERGLQLGGHEYRPHRPALGSVSESDARRCETQGGALRSAGISVSANICRVLSTISNAVTTGGAQNNI
jgi:hypothetical protein